MENLLQERLNDADYDPTSCSRSKFGIVVRGTTGCGTRESYRFNNAYYIQHHEDPFGARLYVVWAEPGPEDKKEDLEALKAEIQALRSQGDPVDVITGNMQTFPQIDFTLAGINEPLEFARTYNSRSDYDGPFGYGWTHNYNIVLTTHDYETVHFAGDHLEVMDGEGKYHFYIEDNGVFIPTNKDGSSVEISGGSYIWTTKEGKKYHFSTFYRTVCAEELECQQHDYLYYATEIEYKDGNRIGLTYTTNPPTGNKALTQITDTYNRTVNIEYDEHDRIVSIDEPGRRAASQLITYDYNSHGNLRSVEYSADAETAYFRQYDYPVYDPRKPDDDAHNLIEIQDEYGNAFRYRYDDEDRCLWVRSSDGGFPPMMAGGMSQALGLQGSDLYTGAYFVSEFDYDPENNQTVVTRVRGEDEFTDTYTYEDGYITQIEHAESGVIEKYSYDIDPEGTSTITKLVTNSAADYFLKKVSHYDSNWNLVDTVEGKVANEGANPTGTPVRMFYEDTTDNPNYLTRILDQRGVNTKFVYANPDGKLTQTYKYKEGFPGTQYGISNIDYNEDGTLDYVTDPNGKTTNYSYTYDQNGVLTSMSIDPPGALPATQYGYDAAGRMIQMVQKDDEGNDRSTDITRDWTGRVTQITYPEEGEERLSVSYEHDVEDLLNVEEIYGVFGLVYDGVNVTDTNGVKTQYIHDWAGLLRWVVKDRGEDKTNAATMFDYDGYGNIISLTDAKEQTTFFTYDSLDRLISIQTQDELQNTYIKSFTYWPDGSLKTRTDQNGQTATYAYNADNRLWTITYRNSLGQLQDTVTYTYESNGLVASVTNSAGTVSYSYDDINRLQSSNGALSGNVDLISYQYHNGGQRSTMTTPLVTMNYNLNDWNALREIRSSIPNPNTLVAEYAYNQYTGNLSRVTNANGTYADYDFDNLDRLASLVNRKSGGVISSFDYDYHDSNLISQVTFANDDYTQYTYDDLYRLANEYALDSIGAPIYTNNFEHDPADNRASHSNGSLNLYTLNALNQITEIYLLGQQPHTTFTYDLNGNMTAKTASASTTTYDYDYENRLVKITYADNGRTEFGYDAIGRLLGGIERNAQGQTISARKYVYDGLDLIAELDGGGALVGAYTHGPGIDDPLLVRYNNANYFFHKNHQGSVTEITGSGQSTVKSYKYDAFGNILQETGPTVPGGFTYTGRQYHSRSGLYYYRARWYSPTLGRFITPDPIGHLGGVNLYTYVGNAPVDLIDPMGLQGSIFAPLMWSPQLGNELRGSFEATGDYYAGMYERAHEIRSEAQQAFPDPTKHDFERHFMASYTLAQEYGTGNARMAGMANEIQGLILYDIAQWLWVDSLFGDRPWAFSLTDLYVNEMAFEAAKKDKCEQQR